MTRASLPYKNAFLPSTKFFVPFFLSNHKSPILKFSRAHISESKSKPHLRAPILPLFLRKKTLLYLDEALPLRLGQDQERVGGESSRKGREKDDSPVDLEIQNEHIVHFDENEDENIIDGVANPTHGAADMQRVQLVDHDPRQGVGSQAADENKRQQTHGHDDGVTGRHSRIAHHEIHSDERTAKNDDHPRAGNHTGRFPVDPRQKVRSHDTN